MPGTLYLVATPIGNLEDITLRALRILREEVTAIACEDTRQTQKLLAHYEIRQPLLSYHDYNEASRTAELLAMLAEGKSLALVSDAGTPLISDPGYRIVSAAVKAGVNVVAVPGASAVLCALTASGLPMDSFLFVGFLPAKSHARREKMLSLAQQPTAVVLYESPHRILNTLAELAEIFGPRPVVAARELTKRHEEFLRGTAAEISEQLADRASVKGEFTLVIGRADEAVETGDPASAVEQLEGEGIARMDAIKIVAKRMGLPKREVYRTVEERGSSYADKNRDAGRTLR